MEGEKMGRPLRRVDDVLSNVSLRPIVARCVSSAEGRETAGAQLGDVVSDRPVAHELDANHAALDRLDEHLDELERRLAAALVGSDTGFGKAIQKEPQPSHSPLTETLEGLRQRVEYCWGRINDILRRLEL